MYGVAEAANSSRPTAFASRRPSVVVTVTSAPTTPAVTSPTTSTPATPTTTPTQTTASGDYRKPKPGEGQITVTANVADARIFGLPGRLLRRLRGLRRRGDVALHE